MLSVREGVLTQFAISDCSLIGFIRASLTPGAAVVAVCASVSLWCDRISQAAVRQVVCFACGRAVLACRRRSRLMHETPHQANYARTTYTRDLSDRKIIGGTESCISPVSLSIELASLQFSVAFDTA